MMQSGSFGQVEGSAVTGVLQFSNGSYHPQAVGQDSWAQPSFAAAASYTAAPVPPPLGLVRPGNVLSLSQSSARQVCVI